MAKLYPVLHNGSEQIPVDDGTYLTDPISRNDIEGVMLVAFYDSNDDIITPTAGTIKSEMSPIEGQWHLDSEPLFDAVDCGPIARYVIPTFKGPAIQGRVTFADLDGPDISYAKVQFWRY